MSMRRIVGPTILAVLFSVTGCVGGGGVGAVGMYASLRAMESALNGVHSVVQQADDATKDRLADADTRMQSTIRDIDSLLTRHEKKGEQIAVEVLNKTFNEGNEEIFTASLAAQDAEVDLNQTISNALINASNVISAVPFIKVKPFVAMVYPTTLLPDVRSDYDVQLLGYFPDELGKPQFIFPNGKSVDASVGADNRLHLPIPVEFVQAYKGKRIKVGIRYKTDKVFLFPDRYITRDIWLDILPSVALEYSVKAEALPDTVYDHPQVIRDAGTPADGGEARTRDIPWGFNDLTPNYDFVNTYDKSASSIESTILIQQGGNNPTGDNSCSVPETAGQRVVLREYAHGKPSSWLEGSKGADVYCKIAITLKLARQGHPIAWHFKNGAPEKGTINWGGDVELFPEGDKPLSSALLDITEYTFDPAQHRTLSLNESTRSKFVQVTNTPTRISLVARSLPRIH